MPAPAYRVVTPRLLLRCPQPQDARLWKDAVDASLTHLEPWMTWVHPAPDLPGTVALLRRFRGQFDLDQDFVYGIFSRDEGEMWGGCGLHPRVGDGAREIGYWIHAAHTGQGLAREATAALTRVAFEVDGVKRVELHIAPGNMASMAVPRALGFVLEGTLRRRIEVPQRGLHDQAVWTLLDDEYPSSPVAKAEVQAFDAAGDRIL